MFLKIIFDFGMTEGELCLQSWSHRDSWSFDISARAICLKTESLEKHCPAWLLAGDHEDAALRTNAVLQAMCSWPLWLCLMCQQVALGHPKPLGILGCMPAVPLAVLLPRHPSKVSQDLFLGLPASFRSLLRLWISLLEKVSVSNNFPVGANLEPIEGCERKSRIISFWFNLTVAVMGAGWLVCWCGWKSWADALWTYRSKSGIS